jgi:hypothetical protein
VDTQRSTNRQQSKDIEIQTHEAAPKAGADSLGSASAQCHHQLAPLVVAKLCEVEGGIALVAKQFDKRGSPFFHRRLDLPIGYPHEVHLEGFGQKIFSVAAARTRQ